MTLSVVIITHNEEANIGRTLASVKPLVAGGKGEIIVVDSVSTDRTVEIARSFGAKVFIEDWKGFAAQKNSALEKASGNWILSLDADEEVEPALASMIAHYLQEDETGSTDPDCNNRMRGVNGMWVNRTNLFLGREMLHGGWKEKKVRVFRRGKGRFKTVPVHEIVEVEGKTIDPALWYSPAGGLVHHQYPTLSDYIDHMNRYSSLGAEMAVAKGSGSFSIINVVLRPFATFMYNYFFRLGFRDGREGLLLHLYHAVYVSWKYAKAWELSRSRAK